MERIFNSNKCIILSKKEQTANFEQIFNLNNKRFAHLGFFSVDKKVKNIWNVKTMANISHETELIIIKTIYCRLLEYIV